MGFNKSLKYIFFITSWFFSLTFFSQVPYQFSIDKSDEGCEKASASLHITGTDPHDKITINWSNGQQNSVNVFGLDAGDFSVYIRIVHTDSIEHTKDTTIYFSIEKLLCQVTVAKFFSPNSDGYNDLLGINNVSKYPNFELQIFNKWGQKVHSQTNQYTPWDGKWNGIELPDGTYYFVFFYNASDKTKLEKGDVTILR